jgi:hypothetical protein
VADPNRRPETDEGPARRPEHGSGRGRPRWGVVLGIVVAIALIGLIVLLHLTGTIGPGSH